MKNNHWFIYLSLILLLTGCQQQSSKCEISSMLLNKDSFPEGTYIEPITSPIAEYPDESAGVSYFLSPDDIYHEVVKWPNYWGAIKEYKLQSKSAFDVDQYQGPWVIPVDAYISSRASNYQIGCGFDLHIYQCRLVARYGKYTVFFKAWISDKGITFSQVNGLIKAIDERMIQCAD